MTAEITAARWYNTLLSRTLAETEDVSEAVLAADLAFSIQPLPVVLDPLPSRPVSAQFAHDIFNRKAQGILNRAVKAAKEISKKAHQQLKAALKETDPQEQATAVIAFVYSYRLQLAELLGKTNLAALLEGAREVASKLPPLPPAGAGTPPPPTLPPEEALELLKQLRELSPREREEVIYELEPDEQQFVRQAFDDGIIPPEFLGEPPADLEDPEHILFPIIDEAVKELFQKNVVSRQVYDQLNAAARAKAFTVTGVDAQDVLMRIRDTLAQVTKEGADRATFEQAVLDAVGEGSFLSEGHRENIFRTNIQSAFSDGQMGVLKQPFVRKGFPYAAYDAIHDDRVRHTHLELEKLGIDGTNLYRIDDPVFQTFRPPWDYMDRCSWYPMTIRQAADLGLKEATTWLATGEEPSPPAFVKMPAFRPPKGFQREITGPMPLSIQLSQLDFLEWGGGSLFERMYDAPAPPSTQPTEPVPRKEKKRKLADRDFDGDCEECFGSEPPGPGWTYLGGSRWVRETLLMAVARLASEAGDQKKNVQLGMVGDEWHGPKPPGEGWVAIQPGPRGGKRWKRGGGGTGPAPPQGKQPAVRRGASPEKAQAKIAEQQKVVATTAAQLQAAIAKGLTQETTLAFAEQLVKMRVVDLQALKKQLGLKASGNKHELATKLAVRAKELSDKTLHDLPEQKQPVATPSQIDKSAPIEQQLKQYTAGDVKVHKLASIKTEVKHWEEQSSRLGKQADALWEKQRALKSHRLGKGDTATLMQLRQNINLAREKAFVAREKDRNDLVQQFGAKKPAPINYHIETDPLRPSWTKEVQANIKKGVEFLDRIVEQGGVGNLSTSFHSIVPDPFTNERRANYVGGVYNHVNLDSENEPADVVVHELGHFLENNLPGAREAAQAFLKYRLKGEQPQKLKDLFPGSSYKDYEYGAKDDFDKVFGFNAWYVGKPYSSGDTEIISMGLQELYKNPTAFAYNDPEYCKFILGILDGSLRS